MSAHADTHEHDDHGHHHKETFVTKYIFSMDHKMIAKQYLSYRNYHGNHWSNDVIIIPYANRMARRAKCII